MYQPEKEAESTRAAIASQCPIFLDRVGKYWQHGHGWDMLVTKYALEFEKLNKEYSRHKLRAVAVTIKTRKNRLSAVVRIEDATYDSLFWDFVYSVLPWNIVYFLRDHLLTKKHEKALNDLETEISKLTAEMSEASASICEICGSKNCDCNHKPGV